MAFLPPIKIFTDAASVPEIRNYAREDWISGFTTNPTLLRKGGVTDYAAFAAAALVEARNKPVSLEIVADDVELMIAQGCTIGSWGSNVVVKVPITTTAGLSCLPVIRSLLDLGIKVNVTAILTDHQVREILDSLSDADDVILSVFAGRIADTGVDPVPLMRQYVSWASKLPKTQILWASPREVLNIVQAADAGCDIITVTPNLLQKCELLGKDLAELSRETVQMFFDDAVSANLHVTSSKAPRESIS